MPIPNIPAVIEQYLNTEDSLARVTLRDSHPTLHDDLNSTAVCEALYAWLAGPTAWEAQAARLAENVINHLAKHPADADSGPDATQAASIVEAFLLHENPNVRLSAYEFLVVACTGGPHDTTLLSLLRAMLLDADPRVTRAAPAYIRRIGGVTKMRPFLERWSSRARERGEANTETYEQVDQLLHPGGRR